MLHSIERIHAYHIGNDVQRDDKIDDKEDRGVGIHMIRLQHHIWKAVSRK